MKEIMFKDILNQYKNGAKIEHLSITESNMYDYYRVECYLDGESVKIVDINGRFENITDTVHTESFAQHIAESLGFKDVKPTYTFIHNPSLWDDDCGDAYDCDFDGYYGDGLDDIEELRYLD